MRNMNYYGHKNDQMCSKRGEHQTFWDILNAGYEYQLPVMRQMALFIWMTNISLKHFGPQVENTKQNDVIKWKHIPCYWPSVRGINKGKPQVTGGVPSQRPLMWSFVFSLICAWTNGWANNGDAGEMPSCSLWRHCNILRFFTVVYWTHW